MVTVEAALKQLPESWQGICKRFEAEGVRGQPHDCYQCPLSRWLTQQIGLRVLVGEYKAREEESCRQWELTEEQQAFVRLFDQGEFPKLEMIDEDGARSVG